MKYRKNGTDAVCGQCDLCGGELRRGERYYRISGVQGLPGGFRGADTGGV